MTTKEAELLAKFDEAIELAEEALELAQEYAGNESETALAISKKISKLARSIKV
jgi:enoyl-CoA hydratase/carnithine racemase